LEKLHDPTNNAPTSGKSAAAPDRAADDTRQKLRAIARKTRREQWYQCGMFVKRVGLMEADYGTLLGGLGELAMVTDHDVASRWKATGDTMLQHTGNTQRIASRGQHLSVQQTRIISIAEHCRL
jgi:hypothetical protein